MPDKDVTDSIELLKWLAHDHFTFLGYREYTLKGSTLYAVEGSGLGILRGAGNRHRENQRLRGNPLLAANEQHRWILFYGLDAVLASRQRLILDDEREWDLDAQDRSAGGAACQHHH